MSVDIKEDRLVDLESRIHELEARFDGVAVIIAGQQPVNGLLEKHGVTAADQREVDAIVSELVERLGRGEMVSFTEFEERITRLVPQQRGDRRFIEVLVEAIKIERPDSRRLCEHFTRSMALLRI